MKILNIDRSNSYCSLRRFCVYFFTFALIWNFSNYSYVNAAPQGDSCGFNAFSPLPNYSSLPRGQFTVVPGAIDDPSYWAGIKEVTDEIYGTGGLAERIGLVIPNSLAMFMHSSSLAMLAAVGRPAIGTWQDGQEIVRGRTQYNILEFVTRGCPCMSVYSTNTPLNEQLSIIMHVAGHLHYAAISTFNSRRGNPATFSSAETMQSAIQEALELGVSQAQISSFLDSIYVAGQLQDMVRGNFMPRNMFGLTNSFDKNGNAAMIPPFPTASIQQALYADLPPSLPAWKRKIIDASESLFSNRTTVPPQKIANEGFATFMQYLMPQLLKSTRGDSFALDNAMLVRRVIGGKLSLKSPYSFGLAMWRNKWEEFKERPENIGLDLEKIAARFVKHSQPEIENFHDIDFVSRNVSQPFVDKHNLFSFREARRDEVDPNLPGFDPKKHNAQIKVISTEAPDIVPQIIQKEVDWSRSIPRIFVTPQRSDAMNKLLLQQEFVHGKPLDPASAIATMWEMARLKGKEVAIKNAIFAFPAVGDVETVLPSLPTHLRQQLLSNPKKNLLNIGLRVEVNVTPDGRVNAVILADSTGQKSMKADEKPIRDFLTSLRPIAGYRSDQEFSGILQNTLDQYRADVNLDFENNQPIPAGQFATQISYGALTSAANRASNVVLNAHGGLAPFNAGLTAAMGALQRKVNLRASRILERIMQGTSTPGGAKLSKTGLRFSPLPDVPNFNYSGQSINFYYDQNDRNMFMTAVAPTLDVKVGVGGRVSPGQKKWAKKPKPGDGGESEDSEDEEGEDGDPSDEPGEGQGGKGDSKGLQVEVSFDEIIKILGLELPNRLRKNGGPDRSLARVPRGVRRADADPVRYEFMIEQAIELGIIDAAMVSVLPTDELIEMLLSDSDAIAKLMGAGFPLINPDDKISLGRKIRSVPKASAVLTVIMDQSGSMHGKPQEVLKKFINFTNTLLKKNYPHIEIIFIGFNHEKAVVMTEEEFYGNHLNGGDYYAHGWRKATEILSASKYAQYDRYAITAGDLNSTSEEAASIEKLIDLTNWSALIQTIVDGDMAQHELKSYIRGAAEKNKWFDVGLLDDNIETQIALIKHFFSKSRKR